MAQTSFTPSRTLVNIQNRGIDEPVFYGWSDLINNDSTDLNLRWVIVQFDLPSQWESFVEDPDSIYLIYKDSADFILPAVQPLPDKLIVSFRPNGQAGRATVALKVYDVNNPSDSVIITWKANAIQLETGVVEIVDDNWQVYPNPSSGHLYVTGKGIEMLELYNLLGERILTHPNPSVIDLSPYQPGTYIARLHDKQGRVITRKVLYQP